jgi:hypothetical protein
MVPPVATALRQWRAKADRPESALRCAAESIFRPFRQIAREDGRFRLAIEALPIDRLARQRHPGDAGKRLAILPRLDLARGADGGECHHIRRSATALDPRKRMPDDEREDGLEPIMIAVMELIGLGGGEQHLVDARREKRGEPSALPNPEGLEHVSKRVLEILHRSRAGIERAQHIDKHDLPIKPREMIAEEGLNDERFVGFVAPLESRVERRIALRL